MINSFFNTYNSLPNEQQQFVFRLLQYLPHPKIDNMVVDQNYDVAIRMEALRKEIGITQYELCSKATLLRNDPTYTLTRDGYKSLLSRNTQDSEWYPYIAKALDVSLTKLKNRTEDSVVSMIFFNDDMSNIQTLFSTLEDKDKKLVMFIMQNLQCMSLGLYDIDDYYE